MSDSSMYNFTSQEEKEIKEFCKLNELDYDKFIKDCFDKGYQIEKYGLLTIDGQTVIEKEVIKEVIKEVPVEKIVEVEKEVIKEIEVPVEVIKEVVKEVPVEIIKEVEKIVEVEKVVEVPVTEWVEVPVEKIKDISDEERRKYLDRIAELEQEVKNLRDNKGYWGKPKTSKKIIDDMTYEQQTEQRYQRLVKEVKARKLDINLLSDQEQIIVQRIIDNE